MSRSLGGTSLTRRVPIHTSPLETSCRPAMQLSSVDLPQPEGPTITTNAPSGISRSTSRKTAWLPNSLLTLRRLTEDIRGAPFLEFLGTGTMAQAWCRAFASRQASRCSKLYVEQVAPVRSPPCPGTP